MNESNTPGTDALLIKLTEKGGRTDFECYDELIEFAHTLERRNQELQKQCEELRHARDSWKAASECEHQDKLTVLARAEKAEAEVHQMHVKANESCAALIKAQVALVQIQQDVRPLLVIIKETMQAHRDKDSNEYNECDDGQCHWCEIAATFLAKHPELKETQ